MEVKWKSGNDWDDAGQGFLNEQNDRDSTVHQENSDAKGLIFEKATSCHR